MSVSREELAAFADGELSGLEAERVSAAIAADPVLAARLEAEKRLRVLLRGDLDPIAAEPVPEHLTLMIAAAAADDAERAVSDAGSPEPAQILDFAAARARRDEKARPPRARRLVLPRWWGTGAAIAASLVLGVFFGTRIQNDGVTVTSNGALIADGMLARGLDERLASAGEAGKLRILTSFQRGDGSYCRVYDAGASSGIACKEGQGWTLQHTLVNGEAEHGEYRQAGSAQRELMAAAQAMASGEPLDAAEERAARAAAWRK